MRCGQRGGRALAGRRRAGGDAAAGLRRGGGGSASRRRRGRGGWRRYRGEHMSICQLHLSSEWMSHFCVPWSGPPHISEAHLPAASSLWRLRHRRPPLSSSPGDGAARERLRRLRALGLSGSAVGSAAPRTRSRISGSTLVLRSMAAAPPPAGA